jgi:biopolymer transport protein ExbD
MLLGKKKDQGSPEIPTSALPDIVFLLLIFFLVTTAIDTEKGLDLVLPPSKTDEIKIPKKNIANLLINSAGAVLIDGEIVEMRDIARVIKERIQDNPKLIVSIKTDKLTKYDVYIDVLDRLKKADAKKISIADPEEN